PRNGQHIRSPLQTGQAVHLRSPSGTTKRQSSQRVQGMQSRNSAEGLSGRNVCPRCHARTTLSGSVSGRLAAPSCKSRSQRRKPWYMSRLPVCSSAAFWAFSKVSIRSKTSISSGRHSGGQAASTSAPMSASGRPRQGRAVAVQRRAPRNSLACSSSRLTKFLLLTLYLPHHLTRLADFFFRLAALPQLAAQLPKPAGGP